MHDKLKDTSKIKVVSWPTPQDYNEALQNPASSFADPELQNGKPELTPLGLPRPVSGMFASVYRMQCGTRDWATRCFLFDFPDQHERYEWIEQHLRAERAPYMLGFDHQEDGLLTCGDRYPFLKMEWCYGVNLNTYVERNLSDKDKLCKLAEDFKLLAIDLRKRGIAHGDLQHGNVMVDGDELKLVDYDGMYVPALSGFTSNELGHRNYQHPGRTTEYFGPNLDNFSTWVIYLTLRCLSIDPSLWRQLRGGDECLLLRQADFAEPLISHSFHVLETHANATIGAMSKLIRYLLTLPVEEVPAIDQQLRLPSDLPEVNPDSRLPDWMKVKDDLLDQAGYRSATLGSKPRRSKKKQRGGKKTKLKRGPKQTHTADICHHCGNLVEVRYGAIAYICPHCGELLNAIHNPQQQPQGAVTTPGRLRQAIGGLMITVSPFILIIGFADAKPAVWLAGILLLVIGCVIASKP